MTYVVDDILYVTEVIKNKKNKSYVALVFIHCEAAAACAPVFV